MKEENKTVQRSSVAEETALTEKALGYPLNIMCSLYYESNESESSISCPGGEDGSTPGDGACRDNGRAYNGGA